MATAGAGMLGARASVPRPQPGGAPGRAAGAAGVPTGARSSGVPRPGERAPGAVEKRGPYMVTRAPSAQAKPRECGPVGLQGRAPGPRWGDPGRAGRLQPTPANLFARAGS